MENPCKMVFFGDSIAKGMFKPFKKVMEREYQDFSLSFVDQGKVSDTSFGGLRRLRRIIEEKPDVVIINFGMNDWRKGVSKSDFRDNIGKMLKLLKLAKIRPVVCTIPPNWNSPHHEFSIKGERGTSREIDEYNWELLSTSHEHRVRVVDINKIWKEEIKPSYKGLVDSIHPNGRGYGLIAECLMGVVPRSRLTVLWQFNGRYAHCNYSCAYCYVSSSVNDGMHFNHSVKEWHKAFKSSFGQQPVTFYLSYGEPTIAPQFNDIIKMIESEPNWELHITTNLSIKLDKLLSSRLVKEGRFHINVSFHPTQIDVNSLVKKLLKLRESGIESPIIYVFWPPQMADFEKYFEILDSHNFVLHARAFRGIYNQKMYPKAYTDEEWAFIAKYMDKAGLKYGLGDVKTFGRKTYLGSNLIVVDNKGNIEPCDAYPGSGKYGNVLEGEIYLDTGPTVFPGFVPLSSVDNIANYVELGYKELEGNHVLSFAKQGGVYYDPKKKRVVYPFFDTDFSVPSVKARAIEVPVPKKERTQFLLDYKWFFEHFVYAFIFRKYGRHLYGYLNGKIKLYKRGRLMNGDPHRLNSQLFGIKEKITKD